MDSSSAAIAAKVRALYGRMLSEQDWERLCRCKGVAELAGLLRGFPAWSQAMSTLPPDEGETAVLAAALERQTADEYVRIYRFASMQDKQYLLFAAYRFELEAILANLRRLLGRGGRLEPGAKHEFFLEKCRSDIAGLNACEDWAGLCRAAEGSIFAPPLAALRPGENGLPEYPDADTLLQSRYYEAVFVFLTRKYSGAQKKRLTEYIGTQADLLNLTHLMRLRRYYPYAMENPEGLLIPVRRRLTEALVRRLAAAPDEEAAGRILTENGWRHFAGADTLPERAYDQAMIAFCSRLLRCPTPGICTAQAYLTLKEIECRRLIRVIEAVRLGVEPRKVL